MIEPVTTLLPAALVAIALSRLSGVAPLSTLRGPLRLAASRSMPARMSFGIGYTLAYLLFIVVFGSNYFAPPGRMGASATLALIVVVAMAVPAAAPHRSLRFSWRGFAIGVALFLTPFVGVVSQDLAWLYLARVNSDPKLAFNSTAAYRKNGEAADRVRELLQEPTISVLLADVGAPSLCCQRLEILDLGLLANAELSKVGWGDFPGYLQERRPDLIQTHGVWSQESGIYTNPQFAEGYTPIVIRDSLFYLRNDLFDRVRNRCTEADPFDPYFYAGLEPASSKKGSDAATIDRRYIESLGRTSFCRLS